MHQELGIRGLFRTQNLALARHGIHGGLGFLIRDNLQENFNNDSKKKWYKHFIIGAAAGVGATLLTTPLDTVRVIHTTRINLSYKEVWREVSKPVAESKKISNKILPATVQNLYAGHVAGQVGVLIYAGLNFGLKDNITDFFYYRNNDNNNTTNTPIRSNLRSLFFKDNNIKKPTWYCSFLSGYLASAMTQFITYPAEILKRRKQAKNISYKELWLGIKQETGVVKKFNNVYRGFSINLVRHPLVNGIVWAVKEYLDQYSME